MQIKMNETYLSIGKVLFANFLAITITLTTAKEILSIISIIIAILYTIYKWRLDYLKNRKK